MKRWYVLFIMTGREEYLIRLLEKTLDTGVFVPFIPLSETAFTRHGVTWKETKPLFPGYVFIESEKSSLEVMRNMWGIIRLSQYAIRFLSYPDTGDIVMRDEERNALIALYNDERIVELSSGLIAGDRIYIKEGPLAGRESIIKKIDRHKREAIIELEFMGEKRRCTVPLVITEKIPVMAL